MMLASAANGHVKQQMLTSGEHAVCRLVQEFVRVKGTKEKERDAMLLSLVKRSFKQRVMVFFRSKVWVRRPLWQWLCVSCFHIQIFSSISPYKYFPFSVFI